MTTYVTRPTLRGAFGMVSSTHWLASASAMAVLERGGNAFDAAVAAGFVLQVAEPHLNGPGGDLPAICAVAGERRPRVLAGQGPAPGAATPAAFRELGMDRVPGTGLFAATVPGAFDAWLLLLRDLGTMEFRDVATYALDYAGGGHPLSLAAATTIGQMEATFRNDWSTSGSVWLIDGRTPIAGQLFANSLWARTLERLIREGEQVGSTRVARIDATRRAWAQGFVAEAMSDFVVKPKDRDSDVRAGFLCAEDIATWSATWEEATTKSWMGYEIAKTGPWGQGPVLLQTLGLLAELPTGDVPDPSSADGIHDIAECLKLAFADREAWYGDAVSVPMETLLSNQYSRDRIALLGPTASLDLRPGSPDGRLPRIASLALRDRDQRGGEGTGEPTFDTGRRTRGDTVHVDVADRWGNLVSATPSGGWLQSSPAIPGLGFCLGTRLQMTWLEEGLPSSLVPGRRPRTTLSPTMVYRGDEPVLACGTPGGDQQDQWQAQFLIRHLAQGKDLQVAIDEPAWHIESFPSSFYPRAASPGTLVIEDRLGADVVRTLSARGHEVRVLGPWSLSRLCAVARDPDSGVLSAGANPRGGYGYAAGR
jgi:gamma-glutamyltranspeptidase/glutathione hydrolase